MKKYISVIFALVLIVVGVTSVINRLNASRTRYMQYKQNQETLFDSLEYYKTLDSLNTVRIGSLTLSLEDYKKYRAEDYSIVNSATKHEKLSSVNTVSSETSNSIITLLRDTVRDTIYADTIKAFSYKSRYTDVNGLIFSDSIKIDIHNREELIVMRSIEKKKFLGIRLPIWLFGQKRVNVRVVSKNPNTQIINSEFVNIK